MILLFLGLLVLGIAGYAVFASLWIRYVFAHIVGLAVLGFFGFWAGSIAKKKGRSYWRAFFAGFVLPIILGIISVGIVYTLGGHGCGGIVSLFVAIVVILFYYLAKKRTVLIVGLFVLAVASVFPQQKDTLKLSGPYLGQKPPGMTPEIFAPGIISKGYFERSVVFSPSQDELFFELRCLGLTTVLLHMKQKNGSWTEPETAFFSGIPEYNDDCPFFTYDGQRLFFISHRPLSGNEGVKKDSDIWILPKIKGEWGEPIHAGNTLNSAFGDDYPTLSKSNNLYFSSNREGNYDIYVSLFSGKGFSQPRRLDSIINTQNYEGHPFIAADESYLIISSDRPGQLGEADLYISFKGKENEWLEPINMGDKINSPFHEVAPYVSPDGKYLFFCSFRPNPLPYGKRRFTYMEIKELLDGPGNGRGDIYWVSAKIIEELRPKEQR